MPDQPTQKLGKLSLAILENFVKSNLGEDFVKELRGDYDRAVTITQALEKTEKRFLREFTDKDLSKAMFVDLSQQDRPALTDSVGQFYDHPTDSNFQEVLCEILLGEFKSLSRKRVEKAVKFYIADLTEELAMLDPEFRGKIGFLIDFRRTRESQEIKPKESVNTQPGGSGSNAPFQNQQLAMNNYETAVFVSYAWGGESERIVGELEQAFVENDMRVVRDKKELGYKGSIETFEQRIGQGQCIVLVISDKYLRSEHCMYELVQVNKNQNLRDRIFPIVLADAQIYKAINRLNYIKYWDKQIEQLNRAIKQVDVITNLSGFTADLDKYASIRASFDHLTDLLSDMNALTPEMHAANGFSTLIGAVVRAMSESKPILIRSGSATEPDEMSKNRSELLINKKPAQGTFQIPPLPPQGVFGREDELKQISDMLAIKELNAESVSPVALRGMGGIGKTTLAIAFANKPEIKSSLRDGVLWTSLGPQPTVRLLLDAWGRALGVDLLPEHDESACQSRLRQVLYDRHMLIVVDDVWDMIQGSYFQVGGPHCRTLFTTREVPIANSLATRERTLRVEVLKAEAALTLLYKLAPETAVVDKNIAIRLCERLEFLPLGLTLAGRMLANEADVPQRMQRLVGELVDRRESRLQLMQTEGRQGLDEENPVSLQAILGMSVDRLSKPDQARFAMLSVFGGEPLTWETNAVSAVWECPIEETEATISRFIQRGLVELHGTHYWMHALLADYAAELMEIMGL